MNNLLNTRINFRIYLTVVIFIVVSLFSNDIKAQGKNFTYFKLMVINDKNEMLLVNHEDKWEPAGRKYDSPETMKTVLKEMAAEMGVEIENPRLRAIIGNYYEESKYPIMFNYVTAQYKSGDIKAPPGCKDAKWCKVEDAITIIPFEGMRMVLNQIFIDGQPEQSWSGAMRIKQIPNSINKTATIIEDFYPY